MHTVSDISASKKGEPPSIGRSFLCRSQQCLSKQSKAWRSPARRSLVLNRWARLSRSLAFPRSFRSVRRRTRRTLRLTDVLCKHYRKSDENKKRGDKTRGNKKEDTRRKRFELCVSPFASSLLSPPCPLVPRHRRAGRAVAEIRELITQCSFGVRVDNAENAE